MFEQATKLKLRFITSRGTITVEDLWDLPLNGSDISLDNIAKHINKELKNTEESFVTKTTSADIAQTLRFDIVKHIIKVKLANIDKAEKSAATKAKKQRILTIMADKANDELRSKSVEELAELLEEE